MKKIMMLTMIVGLTLVFGAGSVLAADQKRDRKRDGTCRSNYETLQTDGFILAAGKQRDRKRDGTCVRLNEALETEDLTLAAAQKRDRKRDGTCRS